jgi:hypothetical protein
MSINILILPCQNIEGTNRVLGDWSVVKDHNVFFDIASNTMPDVIVSMSISAMEKTIEATNKYPNAKLFCYNWDCYEWVWNRPRPDESDYTRYGELLKRATEIWVPSICTGKKTTQWWDLKNWEVILSSCPYWDYKDTTDKGYALCALREIPDKNWDWFEKACEELEIPYKMTKHDCSYKEYQEIVAHCSFLVSHCYELSTGGLTLLEGHYLGKPCLISDSSWHGGIDYLGTRASYFDYNDFENFKYNLKNLWSNPHNFGTAGRYYVKNNFSDIEMVDKMLARVRKLM